MNSQGVGFSPQNVNAVADFRAKTAEAIETLTNAMITDINVIQNLTETKQQLTRNLAEANRQLTYALNIITYIQAEENGENAGGGGGGR